MTTFSAEHDSGRKIPNIFFMLAAIVAASIMWYIVSVHERLEAQVEINLDYNGIPPNLVVTDGLVNKLTVRLRGSEKLLRALTREKITRAINLSIIKKGETTVPIADGDLGPEFRGFQIVDIQPPRIIIRADSEERKSVEVKVRYESPLGDALDLSNKTVYPSTVNVRGPESVINAIKSIPVTVFVDPNPPDATIDPATGGKLVKREVTLDTPSLVTATPPKVDVTYIITSGRTTVDRKCTVVVADDSNHEYDVNPSELSIKVEVPENMAGNESYLNGLEAIVVPPPMEVGESRRCRLQIRMPPGMSRKSRQNDEVVVTKIKK